MNRSFWGVMPALALVAVIATSAVWAPEAGAAGSRNGACRASGCHADTVKALAMSDHKKLACEVCHAQAAQHAANPTAVLPIVRFDLEACSGCHPDQYGTYVYGDDFKTRYGGSPVAWPKMNDFAHLNDIIDGHGFVKEYNEEQGHDVMLEAHVEIARGKYETCLQCKSTKVAYYWDSVKEHTINSEHVVTSGHLAAPIVIPAGTKVKMGTARTAPYPKTHEAQVLVTLPDGTRYSSYDVLGATKDFNQTWAAVYAFAVDGLSPGSKTVASGNGCNHCHDPHRVARDKRGELIGWRIIRKSEIYAIAEGGINPYKKGSAKTFNGQLALDVDRSIALCAQCHVEYVCGKSGIDGIDRDAYGWSKVRDLEARYASLFPSWGTLPSFEYVMDWQHGAGPLGSPYWPANGIEYLTPYPTGIDLIKSQHPEAETYWNSKHAANKANCYVCHMPKVTKTNGTTFTSHWLASPVKYMEPESVLAFASQFGLALGSEGVIMPCRPCHVHRKESAADSIAEVYGKQDEIYAKAQTVQTKLIEALAAIKAAQDALSAGEPVDTVELDKAVATYRGAHVRWENLVISENSMGFHNWHEVETELDNAAAYADTARSYARTAHGLD
jgi:formate-dependent nitrite reductase cytochrome c552 subunit